MDKNTFRTHDDPDLNLHLAWKCALGESRWRTSAQGRGGMQRSSFATSLGLNSQDVLLHVQPAYFNGGARPVFAQHSARRNPM